MVDGLYFAVCTLTTSSIADPNLTLTHEALKLFTVYVLTGIGILVELARELGIGFMKRTQRQAPQGRSARDTVGGITRNRSAWGRRRRRWARLVSNQRPCRPSGTDAR